MEVTITNENFESYKNGELPLVVDFGATWCGPCRMVAPIIEELAKEYDGKLVVGKCDSHKKKRSISSYGMLLFFCLVVSQSLCISPQA